MTQAAEPTKRRAWLEAALAVALAAALFHRSTGIHPKWHMVPALEDRFRRGHATAVLPRDGGALGVAVCKDLDFVRHALPDWRRGGERLVASFRLLATLE